MPRLKWLHGQLKCRQPTSTGTGHFLINLLNYHPILSFQLSSGINKLATLCNCPDNRPLIDSNKRLVARTRLQRLHSCGELAAVSPAEKTLQMRNSSQKFKFQNLPQSEFGFVVQFVRTLYRRHTASAGRQLGAQWTHLSHSSGSDRSFQH